MNVIADSKLTPVLLPDWFFPTIALVSTTLLATGTGVQMLDAFVEIKRDLPDLPDKGSESLTIPKVLSINRIMFSTHGRYYPDLLIDAETKACRVAQGWMLLFAGALFAWGASVASVGQSIGIVAARQPFLYYTIGVVATASWIFARRYYNFRSVRETFDPRILFGVLKQSLWWPLTLVAPGSSGSRSRSAPRNFHLQFGQTSTLEVTDYSEQSADGWTSRFVASDPRSSAEVLRLEASIDNSVDDYLRIANGTNAIEIVVNLVPELFEGLHSDRFPYRLDIVNSRGRAKPVVTGVIYMPIAPEKETRPSRLLGAKPIRLIESRVLKQRRRR